MWTEIPSVGMTDMTHTKINGVYGVLCLETIKLNSNWLTR